MVSNSMSAIAARTETNDELTMSPEAALFPDQRRRKLKRMLPGVRYQGVRTVVAVTRRLGTLAVVYHG